MAGLERIREYMVTFLNARGVCAVAAWGTEARRQVTGPVAAVTLKGCSGGPSGFRDYLGERYDPEGGVWQELYGKRVKVTFGLDLYAGKEDGEAGCQAAFDRLAEALQAGGPEGLKLLEFSRGETEFDQRGGLYRCQAEAVCEAFLYAVADEGGAFLDIRVKGEIHGHDGT